MKAYYWSKTDRNGVKSEGRYCILRRLFGMAFLGESFKKASVWRDNF